MYQPKLIHLSSPRQLKKFDMDSPFVAFPIPISTQLDENAVSYNQAKLASPGILVTNILGLKSSKSTRILGMPRAVLVFEGYGIILTQKNWIFLGRTGWKERSINWDVSITVYTISFEIVLVKLSPDFANMKH